MFSNFFSRLLKGEPFPGRSIRFRNDLPDMLGARPGLELEGLIRKLEEAWNPHYAEAVKFRVIKEGRLSEDEYPWHEFELKRFFVMAAVLRNVPMYSNKVDEIWHEMLMFTRDYQEFSLAYLGEYLHHEPNPEQEWTEAVQEEHMNNRAWFDLIYSCMFEVLPSSSIILGPFFRRSISREKLEEIEQSPSRAIMARHFNPVSEEAKLSAKRLSAKIKDDVRAIRRSGTSAIDLSKSLDGPAPALFASYYGLQYQKKVKDEKSSCSGWSSCSGGYAGEGSHDHKDHHDGGSSCSSNGHSCSGSSCSSSSCGSSCGSS
ncbi:hypothetical protein V1498_11145 [Peribacillus sp. SCS-26]|uniref:hypothetical protein n=1 Tax=Paraperibacillus marinus TaxID=3115295 RepID=UPI003905BE92